MSNYGYGRQNPFDEREDSPARGGAPYPTGGGYPPYAQQQQYGRPQQQYSAPTMGRDEYSGQNVELEPLAPNGQQYGRQNNSNVVLDECRDIDAGIEEIRGKLQEIIRLQSQVLNDADTSSNSSSSQMLERVSSATMAMYRNLTGRVKKLKANPDRNTQLQIGRVDRSLKSAIQDYQEIDVRFQRQLKDQIARQYRIVRPDATENEVKAATEDTSNQVFSQALMQSNRQGQANSTLSAVKSRHADIQKIERQMEELAQLFSDMENLVVQQEAAVTNIEMKGEEVVENMDKGTQEIGTAIKSARNARKWKWWCLGITVLIIVIIVVVILLWQFVFGPNAKANRNQKRFILPDSLQTGTLVAAAKPFDAESNIDVPGLEWTSNHELVRKTRRFQA